MKIIRGTGMRETIRKQRTEGGRIERKEYERAKTKMRRERKKERVILG
jgi:hypothetical protein